MGLVVAVLCVAALLAAGAHAGSGAHAESGCVATTQEGLVVGRYFSPFPSCTYKGIPFAQAPVGPLRFASPEPALPFAEPPFLATEYGPGCIQTCSLQHPNFTCPATTSEDCLTLNVFSPRTGTGTGSAVAGSDLLPVMMFLHGGNFIQGTGGADIYHGSRWAFRSRVVIVTINYRLGALGGLFASQGAISGNYQLQDQRMALRWVKHNARSFGGNPGLVTLFGQSAGGFSVAAHLSSPKSWPLFHRAIVMSDPIALPEETAAKSKQLSDLLVKRVGCKPARTQSRSLDNLGNLGNLGNPSNPGNRKGHGLAPISGDAESPETACLRAVSADRLLAAQEEVSFPTKPGNLLHKFMPWTPFIQVQDEELPLSPMEAAEQGQLAPMPVLIGSVANESIQFVWGASSGAMSKSKYEVYLDAIFGIKDAESIFKLYGNPPRDMVKSGDVRNFLTQIGTDYIFTCSIQHWAELAAAGDSSVYVYYFRHLPSFNDYLQGDTIPECRGWVCHGVDVPVLFDTAYLIQDRGHPYETFQESLLSEQMQTVWANFATSGNPNSPRDVPGQGEGAQGPGKPVVFPPFSKQNKAVLSFDIPSIAQANLSAKQCAVFDAIGYERN